MRDSSKRMIGGSGNPEGGNRLPIRFPLEPAVAHVDYTNQEELKALMLLRYESGSIEVSSNFDWTRRS